MCEDCCVNTQVNMRLSLQSRQKYLALSVYSFKVIENLDISEKEVVFKLTRNTPRHLVQLPALPQLGTIARSALSRAFRRFIAIQL